VVRQRQPIRTCLEAVAGTGSKFPKVTVASAAIARIDRAAATYQGRAAFAVPWAAVICPLLSFTAVSTVSKFQS